jgi:hypothetical protein
MSLASFLLALAIATPAQSLPHIDAVATDEALAMTAVEEGIVEATRIHCGREVADSKRSFDYYAWQWRTQNQFGLNAVAAFASTQYRDKYQAELAVWIDSAMDAFKSDSAAHGAETVCAGFLAVLQSGKRSIASRTPRAWQLLTAYLGSHPLPERDAQQRNITTSCIQQRFSKGADFDQARTVCDCVTAVVSRELSVVELGDYQRASTTGRNVYSLPFMPALRPRLLACSEG